MSEITLPSNQPGTYSDSVRSALDLIEKLLVEGIKHGHFDCAVSCETGTAGSRRLIVRAGMSHKFTIMKPDLPQ